MRVWCAFDICALLSPVLHWDPPPSPSYVWDPPPLHPLCESWRPPPLVSLPLVGSVYTVSPLARYNRTLVLLSGPLALLGGPHFGDGCPAARPPPAPPGDGAARARHDVLSVGSTRRLHEHAGRRRHAKRHVQQYACGVLCQLRGRISVPVPARRRQQHHLLSVRLRRLQLRHVHGWRAGCQHPNHEDLEQQQLQ